jgi:uncharacterized protein involved in exopolysaccharide biosynthesis
LYRFIVNRADYNFDDEIDLGELFQTVMGEWRVVLATFVASLGMAGLYAFAVAPSEYRAQASIRGLPGTFCPVGVTCARTVSDSVADAASVVGSDLGFTRLDTSLNLSDDPYFQNADEDNAAVKARRRFSEAVSVDVTGKVATITARHESDLRAVDIANSVAALMQNEIALDAQSSLDAINRSLTLRLENLPTPAETALQSQALIAIERSSIVAQLANLSDISANGLPVSVVEAAAQLPAERVAPRRPLILALGGVLGLFLGVGFAIVYATWRGRLHAAGAVATAFGGGAPLIGDASVIQAGAAQSLWQEVRVLAGDTALPVIAIAGYVSADTLRHAATGLASEFARSGQAAAIVDLGGWFPSGAAPSDLGERIAIAQAPDGIEAYACDGGDLHKAVAALTDQGRVVIILPPSADADLPLMRNAFLASTARVFLASRGRVTRQDAGRIMMAERGAAGPRVVAVV